MAEEIDREKCNFWQFSEVQKPHDLDFGSGQGHISMHNTCRTTSMPNHLTVASRTAEIWPFEFREISTVRELWTLVIGFLEGNSKIGLWQAVDQVPYYYLQTTNHQFWAPRENGGGDRPRKLHKLHDLDLDRVEVTLVRISGWGLPTHQITSKVEKLFVDVQTDGRTWVPINYVITWRWPNKIQNCNTQSSATFTPEMQTSCYILCPYDYSFIMKNVTTKKFCTISAFWFGDRMGICSAKTCSTVLQ